jgi:transcriptional regulator of NAD metabolism
MDNKARRAALLHILENSLSPVTGTVLAHRLSVSRQIIVSDIAILRAAGHDVYATPQGYVMPVKQQGITATLACKHSREELADELNIIVDNGGKVLDVVVEHPLYGEIKANLMLASRREVDEFMARLNDSGAEPLSIVTGGVHLHTIEISDPKALERMKSELKRRGLLIK